MRILLVEDEKKMARAIRRGLEQEGYAVDACADGEEAVARGTQNEYDAMVLDVMLPGRDGFSVCRELRDRGRWAPILMLTARDAVEDRVRGLDIGADDYMVKPFAMPELTARVRALLRRSEGAVPGDRVIAVGRLSVDLPRRVVTVDGEEVHLTPTEFDLLKELAIAAGRPLTHQMLLRKVWGPGYAQEMQLLRTHMGRLRDKLEAGGIARDSIETLTGVGYRLRDPSVLHS